MRKFCPQCGKEFIYYNKEVRTCSLKCRSSSNQWKNNIGKANKNKIYVKRIKIICKICKISFYILPCEIKKGRIYCSNSCHNKDRKFSEEKRKKMSDIRKGKYMGKDSPTWKGGKLKDSRGYILIYVPNHPFLPKNRKYIPEHRIIMEKHLNRYLKSTEIVHHINEIKDDNRIENLKLLKNLSEHILEHKRMNNFKQ